MVDKTSPVKPTTTPSEERKKFIVENPSLRKSDENKQHKVSDLMDVKGNFNAFAFAQFEPQGHVLQPQPFMAGIQELKKELSPTSNSRPRTNKKMQQ